MKSLLSCAIKALAKATIKASIKAPIQATVLATFLAAAPAQVAISEVVFDPMDQWIEVVNLGTTPAELSSWSLYQATKTAGYPNNYWFALPAGTKLESGELLRVHWLKAIDPMNKDPHEINTGTSVYNFLFGYKPEPLDVTQGALALLNTQASNSMNNATIVEDWVGWGKSGFVRESLAVQNGRWSTGAFVPAGKIDESIALIYSQNTEPTPPSAFFHDSSPTPGEPNDADANITAYGFGCSIGNVNTLQFEAVSTPTAGNRDFALRASGFGTSSAVDKLFVVIGLKNTTGLIWPNTPCKLWLQPAPLILWMSADVRSNEVRMPFEFDMPMSLAQFSVQGIAFNSQNMSLADLAFTSGIEISVGL